MNYIIILLYSILILFSNVSIAQNTKEEASKSNQKSKIISLDKESIVDFIKNDMSWRLSYGITEFQGDLKQEGFLNSNNTSTSYNLSISKKINEVFSISSEVLLGELKGFRDAQDYIVSEKVVGVYDPYKLYEGLGEAFVADFFEIDLIATINLESIINRYYTNYLDQDRVNIFYNIGIGLLSFKSIKHNKQSETDIYGYGYEYIGGSFEDTQDIYNRPKSRVISYGYTISYLINPDIKLICSFMSRIADTDFLDASLMNQENDKFRNITIGIDYDL